MFNLKKKRILAESLSITNSSNANSILPPQENLTSSNGADDILQKVLELSKKEEEERSKRFQEEDEELRKILELSLLEK